MGMINVDEIQPGMVLGRDLVGPNGRFLLAAGTTLEEKHFQIFKIWGVAEADIEDVSPIDVAEQILTRYGPEIIKESRLLVSERFAVANREHEAISELYRLAVLQTAEFLKNSPDTSRPVKTIPDIQEKGLTQLPPLNISDVIKENIQFVTLPSTFLKVHEAINNPRSSSRYIAKAVSLDISLSTKLLKLVNSAFYGFPRKIETLSQAVTLIGTKQLGYLAQGVSLIEHFKKIPDTVIDMKSFWHHSISCGIIARLLGDKQKISNSDAFWVAGLLHDAGRLFFLQGYPDYVRAVFIRAWEEHVTPDSIESGLWGLNHAEVAGLLFEKWHFPQTLENAVKYHHAPHEAQSAIEPSIIHLADIIAHGLGAGKSGNPFVPPLVESAWGVLEISKNDLAAIITQANYQIDNTLHIFLS